MEEDIQEENIQIVVLGSARHFTDAAVRMHRAIFPDEFIVSLGQRFLRRYYHAFSESPYGVVLVAVRGKDVVGGLLGSVDPVQHYRRLTRRHGSTLALSLLMSALARPKVAKALVETRLKRYVLGVLRQLSPARHQPPAQSAESASPSPAESSANETSLNHLPADPRVGEITHLFVDPELRGLGIGAKLVSVYEEKARHSGVDCVELVTLPFEEGGAGRFYERLGWRVKSSITSRSGESFELYEKWFQGDSLARP
ncbi:GNAT family N-acetyltransferase [Alicyclobacillus ferrooxydans]|uniref:GNAT family N-acetyltransferase n=1 Tax=Alicyclobacillus ferrooxydans TaxID=471514 RepID=UPI0006D55C2D|nr:GNAT family N-acetyltransferase [Alicyclobacillus ferrooxydans]